jgi:hypothetical protein
MGAIVGGVEPGRDAEFGKLRRMDHFPGRYILKIEANDRIDA